MSRLIISAAIAALLVGSAHANITINGKICDDSGKPIVTQPKPPSKPTPPPVHTPTAPKPAPTQTQSQSQSQHQAQLQQQVAASSSKSNSASKSSSSSKSNSTATGGSVGAISNNVGPSTSSATGGDASGQSVTESSVYSVPRQTPPAFAGNVQPTASCRGAINGGASAPVAGISFGFSKKDDECDAREAAREFYEMGRPDLAIMVLCKTKVGKALGDACTAAPRVVVVTQDDIDLEVKKRQHEHGFPNVNK